MATAFFCMRRIARVAGNRNVHDACSQQTVLDVQHCRALAARVVRQTTFAAERSGNSQSRGCARRGS